MGMMLKENNPRRSGVIWPNAKQRRLVCTLCASAEAAALLTHSPAYLMYVSSRGIHTVGQGCDEIPPQK